MILFKAGSPEYVGALGSYRKTRSYREGARWNRPNTPVLYFSSNVQNAMLELGNYLVDPLVANELNVMAVFESPALSLYSLEPHELPQNWAAFPRAKETQEIGDAYLLGEKYDGLLLPSSTINPEVATSHLNDVRQCVYANVVLNPEREAVKRIREISRHSPIFSERLFNGTPS